MATLSTSFSLTEGTPAIIVPGTTHTLNFSYAQLAAHVSAFQGQLAAMGLAPRSAVSIVLPNSYEFIVSFLASTWQRSIAAPLNPSYKQEEYEFYINDLKSDLVLIPRDTFDQNGPVVRAARKYNAAIAECFWDGQQIFLDSKAVGNLEGKENRGVQIPQPDDVALVLHTSGTTGRPKAVPLTHENLTTTMKNIRKTYDLKSSDRTLLVMPLFHVHGILAGFLAPLHSGGSVIVPPRFSASEFWQNFINHRATWYTAVPTIHQILLRNPLPNPIPSIRFIRSCSSPLSPKVFHELEHALKAPVLEAYAMTEAAHQMTSNPLPPAKRLPGSVGVGHGVEVKILDKDGLEVPRGSEAEICVRGDNVMKGYLNNVEATSASFTKDNYFRTGDQGKQDQEGYVIITGRIKELINKGGEKISPVEIDNVAAQHPSVSEAVSFAIADELYGQDIGLAVVIKDGASLNMADLRDWFSTKLVRFKTPKQIFFTETMPKTATGKIQRKQVAETMFNQADSKPKL